MHVRVCVDCGEEYRPEVARCADCGGELDNRHDEGGPFEPAATRTGKGPCESWPPSGIPGEA